MNRQCRVLTLLVGVVSFQGVIAAEVQVGAFTSGASDTSFSLAAVADASKRFQVSGSQVDFEEDDALDQADEGFNAVYIDNLGNVLGTFVNIPGAKVKVYADGRIELEERDYTTEVDYRGDGRVMRIGDVTFSYFRNGRIRTIDDIDFSYSRNGRLRGIGDLEIRYFASGRLKEIDTVDFEYEPSGILRTISETQTDDGILIVVVN